MVPVVVKAFEAKGYLPYRASYHWRNKWKHAIYHASIVVSEKLEGNLPVVGESAHSDRGTTDGHDERTEAAPIFQTMPTARSTVPLPKLPAYLSNRLAMTASGQRRSRRLLAR